MNVSKARLIARMKADGSVFKSGTDYVVSYDSSDVEEIGRTRRDIEDVYGLRAKVLRHRSGVNPNKMLHKLFVRSKRMYEDLQLFGPYASREWNVSYAIKEASKEVRREFIRTFFEDEGTVLEYELKLYSVNRSGLEEIKDMLQSFGIKSSLLGGYGSMRNVFGLIIREKESRKRFAENIGFLSKRKTDKLIRFHTGQR